MTLVSVQWANRRTMKIASCRPALGRMNYLNRRDDYRRRVNMRLVLGTFAMSLLLGSTGLLSHLARAEDNCTSGPCYFYDLDGGGIPGNCTVGALGECACSP